MRTKKKRERLESKEVTCEYGTDIESQCEEDFGIEHRENRL